MCHEDKAVTFFGTELIKMHPRKPPGGRSTDAADYPAQKAIYALRDVDALRAKAKERGVHVGVYAERLLGGPLPWTKMREVFDGVDSMRRCIRNCSSNRIARDDAADDRPCSSCLTSAASRLRCARRWSRAPTGR